MLMLVLLQCFKKRGVDDIVDWDHPRLLDIYCIFAGNSLVSSQSNFVKIKVIIWLEIEYLHQDFPPGKRRRRRPWFQFLTG